MMFDVMKKEAKTLIKCSITSLIYLKLGQTYSAHP